MNQIPKIFFFLIILVISLNSNGFFDNIEDKIDPYQFYGLNLAKFLFFLKIISFIGLPITLINLLGNLIYPIYSNSQLVRGSPDLYPFINIRVVTRGIYPDLVCRNVERNLKICEEFGINKFVIEVVTDKQIFGLPLSRKVSQIVIPNDYNTKSGAKFKARALQYALESYVNSLNDEDWIVHLDEETILTHSALVGILNFSQCNK